MAERVVTPFGPEELKAKSRTEFVDNEYRETQPDKGLNEVAHALDDGGYMPRELRVELIKLTGHWLTVMADDITKYADTEESWRANYAGADELKPVLNLLHDYLWGQGQHPYYDTLEELEEYLKDD